ncbi:D-amino-acid transaminase [Evansella cellulosilytica]|uniref:D-alanine aminotransferase n=1 Tax=Evansella cellulosilytica (strain ATCC 21833 / DSM 2522 / FERM P-1141 / JCM 9156 / N-4) TaxID=649639 RepID=E6TZQ3_EVAC2|nr:D-amino-acid transaminase [Evansella cellulosilytica]ADU31359.1 D-amino acid aminotransferase [Evansella cellulosilytica DSM 2522]
MAEIAFYENKFVDINEKVVPIQERGHQFGDGIYEVVRVYNGQPFLLEEHLERFQKSADAIELVLPFPKEKITAIIDEGITRSEMKEADVYFQLTRGIAPRQHNYPECPAVFSMTVRKARPISNREKGISVITLEDERWLNCYIKSLNLLPNIIAKQKALKNGHGEAILVREGIVTEGSSSNVFAVKDGKLYTHPATKRILHGITRAKVMQLAKELRIPLVEKEFTTDFLKNADEAFITSTSAEVMPIHTIDDTVLPVDRPISSMLVEEFVKLYHHHAMK